MQEWSSCGHKNESVDLRWKMSRFSKFCKFLSETGEGLKLVAFFLAAQHLFVAFYEGEPDFPVLLGEVRDRFFDETSPWCLPNKVLEVIN